MLALMLVNAGLDHIQISFQDSHQEAANWIAGAKAHAHKIKLSRAIRRHSWKCGTMRR
jgi:hypothetical protein